MFGPSEATLDFLRDIREADDRQWRLADPSVSLTAPPTYQVTLSPEHRIPDAHCTPPRMSVNWPATLTPPASLGWQCPSCGYCYAPGMPSCSNCNRPEHLKTSTGTSVQVEMHPRRDYGMTLPPDPDRED